MYVLGFILIMTHQCMVISASNIFGCFGIVFEIQIMNHVMKLRVLQVCNC